MKFTIERANAVDGLAAVQSIVSRKTTIPILLNIMLETGDGFVRFSGTDLDMLGMVEIPAHVETPGGVTVSAYRLLEIVKSLPDGADFTMETQANDPRIALKAGRSRFQMHALPVGDFPVIAMTDSDRPASTVTVQAKTLARLLDAGGFCAPTDDSRFYLNAAYMHTMDGQLRVISTNTKRLSMAFAPTPDGLDLPDGMLMTPRTIAMLQRLIGFVRADDPVELTVSPSKLAVSVGSARLVTKLLDKGDKGWMQYWRVIAGADEPIGIMVADTDMLLGALKRAMIMADTKDGSTIVADMLGDTLTLAGRSLSEGEGAEELEIEWTGSDHRIQFNGAWMLTFLERIATENVIVKVSPGNLGMAISETGDTDWLGVLAPQGRE